MTDAIEADVKDSVLGKAFRDAVAMKTDGYRYLKIRHTPALWAELTDLQKEITVAVMHVLKSQNGTIEVGFDMSFLSSAKPELKQLLRSLTDHIPYSNNDAPNWQPVARIA